MEVGVIVGIDWKHFAFLVIVTLLLAFSIGTGCVGVVFQAYEDIHDVNIAAGM